ncbi:MAG: hypothetical protein PWP35_2369 [Bacteroidales bacterium]|jgi:hypothetical protein|nr:hypothetical protein [Bacteroidales bacterium]
MILYFAVIKLFFKNENYFFVLKFCFMVSLCKSNPI